MSVRYSMLSSPKTSGIDFHVARRVPEDTICFFFHVVECKRDNLVRINFYLY